MMKTGNDVPKKFSRLRPQTVDVLWRRGWHDPKENKWGAIAPMERGLTGEVCTSIAYVSSSADELAEIFEGSRMGFAYPRISKGTPPVDQLSHELLRLELGRHYRAKKRGYGVLLTGSGMAQIVSLVLTIAGKHGSFISSPHLYGGTFHFFNDLLPDVGIRCHMIDDPRKPDQWERAARKYPNAKFFFAEDDSNPMLVKLDNAGLAEIAHRHNMLYFVDRTIGTAILEQPLLSGADGIIHSLSKNVGGRSAGLGGALIARKKIIGQIRMKWSPSLGGVMDPRVADYMLFGLRDLKERMRRKIQIAKKVVSFLERFPLVKKVYWSGTDLLSFEIDGSSEDARRVLESLKLIFLAPHLGDDYPLAVHPASTTHAVISRERRLELGISDSLIRLSVGLFDPIDIIEDLYRAMMWVLIIKQKT